MILIGSKTVGYLKISDVAFKGKIPVVDNRKSLVKLTDGLTDEYYA